MKNLFLFFWVRKMIFSQMILQATTTDLTPILSTLGIPAAEGSFSAVIGYLLGKLAKTIIKILLYLFAFFVGVEIALATWLENTGAITITVNYDKLTEISTTASSWITSELGQLTSIVSSLTIVGVGFGGGFILGLTH